MTDHRISRRKDEHLEICAEEPVEFTRQSTWLEDVHLVHHALPEFGLEDVDTSLELGDRHLAAPVLIGAMTGGSHRGAEMNRDLAVLAEELGIGMGLGSQRAALESPELASSFRIRPQAPTALLIGNLGVQQLGNLPSSQVLELMERMGLDMLAVHLNPAMELFQREGDREFRGGQEALRQLASVLGTRLMVKETGCGISRETARLIRQAGIRMVDVAGAGGTSWVKVECRRSPNPDLAPPAGQESPFEEWGIPTAASVVETAAEGLEVIASGGIRDGLDAVRAMALGARAVAVALPVLRAYHREGVPGARHYLERLIREIQAAMLLIGCRNLQELRSHQPVILGRLAQWIRARGLEG